MKEVEIELLKKAVESNDLQLKRLVSHFDSEGRNRELISHISRENHKKIEKLESQLYENGKGLVGRVGKLEVLKEHSKDNKLTWIAIAGIVVSLILGIINLVK